MMHVSSKWWGGGGGGGGGGGLSPKRAIQDNNVIRNVTTELREHET